MTVKGYVSDKDFGYGVSISLVDESDTRPPRIIRLEENGWFHEPVEPGIRVRPTLRLDDASARALLDGLMRYYHGAEDTRQLRLDYNGERDRVDHLTESAVGLAHRIADIAGQLAGAPQPLAPLVAERISR